MSDNPFYHDYMGTGGINTFPFFGESPSNYDQPIYPNIQNQNQHHQFVPSSNYMSLTECLHGSMDHYNTLSSAFAMSCSSPEVVCPHVHNQDSTRKNSASATAEPVLDSPLGETSVEIPPTPNSSISSTSNEAGGQEDSSKIKKHIQKKGGQEDGDDKSKK
ncbi:Transcription factor, partial [Datura stramonium]|nr:Transcription factor [Datura stramonium]